MKRLGILIALVSLVSLVPSFSTAQMMMKHDQMMSPSQSMDESKMEEMHKMMPRMMRHMMEMMHEMMGMMKGTVQEEKDKEKLEGMMEHIEKMMKGYDEAVEGTDNKTMGETYESGTRTKSSEANEAKESGGLTKKAEAGGVTAEVTYLNPGEDNPAFEVKFDTHSVELDQYKLESIVSLRDEDGEEYATPIVESPSGSGHHRSGVLRFKDADISKAEAIEIVIKDVAGVKERVFRFEIKK